MFDAFLSLTNQVNNLNKLYAVISSFIFYRVLHEESKALEKHCVNILQKIVKAAFVEISLKLEAVLQNDSDNVLNLTDNFCMISYYVNEKLFMTSYYENNETSELNERVRLTHIISDACLLH